LHVLFFLEKRPLFSQGAHSQQGSEATLGAQPASGAQLAGEALNQVRSAVKLGRHGVNKSVIRQAPSRLIALDRA
jgi:hypothetical protein